MPNPHKGRSYLSNFKRIKELKVKGKKNQNRCNDILYISDCLKHPDNFLKHFTAERKKLLANSLSFKLAELQQVNTLSRNKCWMYIYWLPQRHNKFT